MELKDFVADTLTQICQGIQIAQENTKAMGAFISPRMAQDGWATDENSRAFATHKVSYDVALEVIAQEQEKTGSNIVGKIVVAIATIGGKTSQEHTDKEELKKISRIRFDIPVIYPRVMPVDKEFEQADANYRLIQESKPKKRFVYGYEDD